MKLSLLTMLATAAIVTAQDACNQDTNNVQNQGDASALSGCKTIKGDIVLAKGVTSISLDGIQQIGGSLICENAIGLTSLSGSQLASIGNSFTLTNATILSSLNFPSLTSVGSIMWRTVPALSQLSFTSQVTTAKTVLITDTGLTSLNGINLVSVDTFDINNNLQLNMVDVKLGNVSNSLNIAFNSKSVTASFPNLIWANNMTFRNVSSVMVPSLSAVNGSMGFYSDLIKSFIAPNLTKVGGTLSFVDNNQLTNLSFPALTDIGGGFQIANNTMLAKVDGLPKLAQVGGAGDIHGPITDAPLPSLQQVKGGFNFQSSETFDCTQLNNYKSSGVIRGTETCKSKVETPSGNGDGTQSGSGSSTSSSAAANGNYAADMLALSAATGLVPFLLRVLF